MCSAKALNYLKSEFLQTKISSNNWAGNLCSQAMLFKHFFFFYHIALTTYILSEMSLQKSLAATIFLGTTPHLKLLASPLFGIDKSR